MRRFIALVPVLMVLTPGASASSSPAPEIAFERRAGSGVADIYSIRSDGTGLRRLTRTRNNFDPSYSPDGRSIVFASDRTGAGAPELYVMRADGGTVRRLTRSYRGANGFTVNAEPVWAPDGRTIVFVRTVVRAGRSVTDLWSRDVRDGTLKRLTAHRGREASPSFGPGGSIVFERDGFVYELRNGVVSATGRRGVQPARASDGSYLAYVRAATVYTTLGQGERALDKGSVPAFSPDARELAYATEAGLVVASVRGGRKRRLTDAQGLVHDTNPAWRP